MSSPRSRRSLATSAGDRPVVLLRAEGGRGAGLGHFRRSLALAGALAPWAERWLLFHGDATTVALARRAGVPCLAVGSAMDDALGAVRSLRASVLVVDSYAVSPQELETACDLVRLLVVVDDMGRFPVPAHLVVNSALGLDPPRGRGTSYLLGPRFALLGPEFADLPARSWRERVERVLLVLGGATPAPLAATLARAAYRALPHALVDIVVGPVGDDPDTVERALAASDRARLHIAPESLRPLMLGADVAMAAGGVTLLELAATGTPTVGICLAPNQRLNLAGLERDGALLFAGLAGDPALADAVEAALADLAVDARRRLALGARARQLVDGRGAARVAGAIRERLAEAGLAARSGAR